MTFAPDSTDFLISRAWAERKSGKFKEALPVFNILNQFDLPAIEEGSADYYHLLIEATKLAFEDRDKYLTDPEFSPIPLDELLSVKRGIELSAKIDYTNQSIFKNNWIQKGIQFGLA